MNIIPQKLVDKIDAKVDAGKVIPEWRTGWKLHSVQAQAVGLVVNAAVASIALAIPPSLAVLEVWTIRGAALLCVGLSVAGIVGRLLVQDRKPPDP